MFCCGGLGLCLSLCYYHACQNLFVHVCDFMFRGTFCGTGAQSRVCERWYLSSSCVWIMEAWVKWSHITTDSPETPNKRPGFHQCVCLSHCMYSDSVTAAIKVIVSHRIRYLMDTKALHPPFLHSLPFGPGYRWRWLFEKAHYSLSLYYWLSYHSFESLSLYFYPLSHQSHRQ